MRLIATLACLGLVACSPTGEESPPRSKPADGGVVPTLEVVPVVSQKLEFTERLPGELTPFEVVAIFPRVSGFLDEISVDRGSRVSRGQVLARLSAPEISAQRAEAEAKVQADKSTAERLRAASATPGVVARHDVELAQDAVKATAERVRALKQLEDYLVVRAPFNGVVVERNVHPGALVGPPSGPAAVPMLRIEEVQLLRLTVAVPENDVSGIAEGASADFGVKAWPGRTFTGTVRRIAHSIDTRTRTMPVELDVENKGGLLAPGMFAEVRWPVRRQAPSLLVPTSAVVQTTERTYVDRVKDGVLQQVPITRGVVVGDKVEVYGQLNDGDTVLRRGSEELRDGTKINVKAGDGNPVR